VASRLVVSRRFLWRWLTVVFLVGTFALLVWVLFFPLADFIAMHDAAGITAADRAVALDAARGRLLQLGALFAAGAFVYNARSYLLA
jgi:hypothetical protein